MKTKVKSIFHDIIKIHYFTGNLILKTQYFSFRGRINTRNHENTNSNLTCWDISNRNISHFFFFVNYGNWTWGLLNGKQTRYHWANHIYLIYSSCCATMEGCGGNLSRSSIICLCRCSCATAWCASCSANPTARRSAGWCKSRGPPARREGGRG